MKFLKLSQFVSRCRIAAGIYVLVLGATAAQAYVPDTRWTSTSSGSTGAEGNPITLTWGFARDGNAIPNESNSNLMAYLDNIFNVSSGGNNLAQRPWFSLFQDSFKRWAELGGVTFVYEPNDDGRRLESANGVRGVRADIRIGGANIDGANGTLAYTFLPNSITGGGDMVVDTSETTFFANSANNYRQLRNTIMHELGHAIGLSHVLSNSSDLLMEPFISAGFDGPQLDEIRGIHGYYGDALEKTNGGQGNDTYTLASALGSLTVGGNLSIGSDAAGTSQAVGASETDFVSITNSDDVDYYSFSVAGSAALSAVLMPLGGVFTQGAEGEAQASFNANARNDLSLTLFDRNGTSLLASANSAAAGQAEQLTGIGLSAAGQYYIRVAGASDSVQLYQLQLTATAAVQLLAGDYNRDGAVDAADYVVWRNTVGQVGASLIADGNGNGVIDAADYLVWRDNFGSAAATSSTIGNVESSAVPEPPTTVGVLVLAAAFYFGSKRNSRTRAASQARTKLTS